MAMMLNRSITPGSRQAPDPYDQFLERYSFYRKHTARDASCLFRVIAEQMYDTQMLHYEVRLECVRFMTRKRRIFEKDVQGNYDSYLLDMAKPRTYGTIVELRALCCLYRRNAILFEPFKLGSLITYNKSYRDKFQVFYTNDNHFDSIYTLSYVKEAAICQSITFKLLYKLLFKLPDVNYAVENMLHPETFQWGNCQVAMDTRGYIKSIYCRDGRIFYLDMPETTKCILENSKQCNFHNNHVPDNDNASGETTAASTSSLSSLAQSRAFDEATNNLITVNKSLELLYVCPNRLSSCVRQLLDYGITPFPYKVAKALDPCIYRNIEFDSWNDMRKEAKRYDVYINDYNFKTGAKCRVELLIEDDKKMYTCYIQKIYTDKSFCMVHVEKFGKQILVPYVSLHPLPPDEFRPWSMPFHYRRQPHQNYKMLKSNVPKWKKTKLYDINYYEASNCAVMQYLQLDNYYGCHPLFNEHHPNSAQHESDRVDPAVLREQHAQIFMQQPPPPPHLMETGTAPVLAHPQHQLQQQQPGTVQLAMAGSMGHGQLTSPWPIPVAGPRQAGVYPGLPPPQPSADGMLMHNGGYAQPLPLPPLSLQSPPALPSFATTPYMIGPQHPPPTVPPLMLPPSNCSNSDSCTTSSISRTITTRGSEAQLEPRRADVHSNGEDLHSELPSDVAALQYFYKMGLTMHMRLSQMQTASNPNEQMRLTGINLNQSNNQTHYNTNDQLQVATQMERSDESLLLVPNSSSTPPPSPGGVSSTEPAVEKDRPKRGKTCSKMRSEARPEQLSDLGNDKQQLSHALMLLTPTPSPNTQGNRFNFYPIASQHQQQHPQPSQAQALPNAPMLYTAIRAGQNPYAWRMPGETSPHGAPNMVGMPYGMMHNYEMEPPPPQLPYGPPRH